MKCLACGKGVAFTTYGELCAGCLAGSKSGLAKAVAARAQRNTQKRVYRVLRGNGLLSYPSAAKEIRDAFKKGGGK